jgi:hypothetical protein
MISLSEEVEAIVKAKAASTGRTPDEILRDALARTGEVLPWPEFCAAPACGHE